MAIDTQTFQAVMETITGKNKLHSHFFVNIHVFDSRDREMKGLVCTYVVIILSSKMFILVYNWVVANCAILRFLSYR